MPSRSLAPRLGVLVAVLISALVGALFTPVGPAIAKEVQTVFVTNTAAEPVPVSPVGIASVRAVAPDRIQGSNVLSTGGTFVCETIYTVPSGKRLTIQYISAIAYGLVAGNSATVRLGGTQVFMQVSLPMHPVPGNDYAASEMVQMSSTTNISACATFAQAQGSFNASLEVSWSGILEDVD